MKENLSNKEITDISEKQFIIWIKNILNALKNDTKIYIFFSNTLKLYKEKKYKNFDYKKIQELFIQSWKKVGWWKFIIEDRLIPTIDFKQNENLILKDLSKYIKNNKNYKDCITWIAKYLKDHIQYPFFLWLSQTINHLNKNTIKLLNNTIINQNEINFILNKIWWVHYLDKHMNIFIEKLKKWNTKEIQKYLINNFSKFSKSNKEFLYYTFAWLNKSKDKLIYSYLNHTTAYNILYKFHEWDCDTISLIAKKLFNKVYKWKNVKILYILNYWIGHAYNIMLVKNKNWIRFKYLDFLEYIKTGNLKDIFVKYLKKYEIYWENNILNNKTKNT